jgi:cation transport regulator ChaC
MKCISCGHDDHRETTEVIGIEVMHLGCAIDYLLEQINSLRSYVELLRGILHMK